MLPVATMVNSRNDEAMIERIVRIETKLDDLAASVGQRFDTVDTRFAAVGAAFDAVDGAFVEQRQYTEFAFEKLDARFDKMDARFDKMDARFDRLERKLDQFIKGFGAPKRGPRRR